MPANCLADYSIQKMPSSEAPQHTSYPPPMQWAKQHIYASSTYRLAERLSHPCLLLAHLFQYIHCQTSFCLQWQSPQSQAKDKQWLVLLSNIRIPYPTSRVQSTPLACNKQHWYGLCFQSAHLGCLQHLH